MATPEKYGGSYLKNLLADAPELLFCTVLFAISGVYIHYKYLTMGDVDIATTAPYKNDVIVIRPDDPLVETLIKKRQTYYADPMKVSPSPGIPVLD